MVKGAPGAREAAAGGCCSTAGCGLLAGTPLLNAGCGARRSVLVESHGRPLEVIGGMSDASILDMCGPPIRTRVPHVLGQMRTASGWPLVLLRDLLCAWDVDGRLLLRAPPRPV